MVFDVLHFVYLGLAGMILVLLIAELVESTNWRLQVSAAIAFVPLVLRVLLVR